MATDTMTEEQMRDADVPWPKSETELMDYIKLLVEREHDYGTCVYAMSMAAVAAFHYVSHKLGVTGFQASCADMDILRRTRHYKGGFMLVNGDDLLYPQYDLRKKLDEFIAEQRPWLKEQATKMLADRDSVHPDVKAHWERLAKG